MYRALNPDQDPAIQLPPDEQMEQFKTSFTFRCFMLKDVFFLLDCLKVRLQISGYAVIQNMFENGWTHSHKVGRVFVFNYIGKIIACAENAPGSFHDSSIQEWGGV